MAHDHDHDATDLAPLEGSRLGRRLRLAGGVLLALAAIGLVALWPRGDAPDLGEPGFREVDATVLDVRPTTCPGLDVPGDVTCRLVEVRVTSGPDDGSFGAFAVRDIDPEVPELEADDEVVLRDAVDAPEEFRYSYSDLQRTPPLLLLGLAFAVVVVVFGRMQGVRALLGLAASLLLLVTFLVPALLRGEPVLPVALVAGVVITGLALYLAHGFSTATSVAFLGTLAALVLVTLLALLVVGAADLTGLAQTEAQTLTITAEGLDLRGLLVAGIVIGVLGSLDDVTITQVSAVAALRRADPSLGPIELYREAIRIGRDHVASSVNTLVLAYAGASLPLLLFFAQSSRDASRVITGEVVAVEIVRMLVGSIGLVAAVPLTTVVAAWALTRETAGTTTAPEAAPARREGRPLDWEDFGPADDLA